MIQLPERLLFAGGREWAASQAHGDVLEVAVGTGRNLPHYPTGVRLVGVDISSAVLDLARGRAQQSAAAVDLDVADA